MAAMRALRISAWNAQGLFMHRRYALRASVKRRQMQAMTERGDVVIIVEAHGLAEDVATFRREVPQFLAWMSAGTIVGAGGIAILVRREILRPRPHADECDWRSIGVRFIDAVRGRAAYIDLATGAGIIRSSECTSRRSCRCRIAATCCDICMGSLCHWRRAPRC